MYVIAIRPNWLDFATVSDIESESKSPETCTHLKTFVCLRKIINFQV